jgi:type II secretory ATPase GspE/PulE/Tfp pilus assembly ATPase PilB-like protein
MELVPGARKGTPALRSVAEILLKVAEQQYQTFHIEPMAQGATVKAHVAGASRELMHIPDEARHSIISMIKMLSCMNDAERSVQYGGFQFGVLGRRFDVHVTVMPTYFGEKAFLQLTDSQSECTSLAQLGLAQDQAKALEGVLQLQQGMLLIAGPPATGRTQVLAAALNHLRSSGRSIVAIEDATEHLVEGVTHIQLGPRFDWDASSCLRSVLRQNADVIMIAELRDAITAELALRASRNGRLVLCALVADDTADAVLRLRDFGIPQRLIATVSGIVSPRTVRTRCSCRRELTNDAPAANCALCGNSGFRGTTGIYEVLVVEGNVRAALEDDATPSEIRDILRGTAIRTLHEDAMEKVMAGVTTLDEVLKVLPRRKTGSYASCSECSEPLAQVFRYCPYCGCSVTEKSEVSSKAR